MAPPRCSSRATPRARGLGSSLGRNLTRRRQHGQRDRQVEAGALLPQLGRRQIDRDPPHGPLELRGRDPRADALLRLLAGAVGQPDDRERRHPELEVRLDLDAASVEPDQRVRDRPCEHASNVDSNLSRVCDGFVPKVCLPGEEIARGYRRSTSAAMAWPKPMHMVATP